MFTYVKLKNYKSLVDFEVDLTSSKNNPKKIIIIYGENGAGKTNFINAFFTLFETLNTKIHYDKINKFINENLDNKNNLDIIKDIFKSTDYIINDSKTIGSKGNMVLEFGFILKDKESNKYKNGVYYIETDNKNIVKEKLEYTLTKNKTIYFEIDSKNKYINKSLFKEKYYNEIKDLIDKFWGKHSFLSILLFERNDKTKQYIDDNIKKNLFDVIEYFLSMSIHLEKNKSIKIGRISSLKDVIINMDKGIIKKNDEHKLKFTEEILNDFFTSIYSDVKKVFYKKKNKEEKILYNLFFKKRVYGKMIDVNFDLESNGTQKLLKLLPFLLTSLDEQKSRVVAVDELDSGIHDLLTSEILVSLFNNINGQFFITTHNTTILESNIDKDSIYVFNIDSIGNKILVPIKSYENEHPNINFRKRYLNGIYHGIPITSGIDFEDILKK